MAIKSGSIEPVKVIEAGNLQENGGDYVVSGRVARRVYRFSSEARPVRAGSVLPVYLVSQAELDSGTFRLSGNTAMEPIISIDDLGVSRPVQGQRAIPVFVEAQE